MNLKPNVMNGVSTALMVISIIAVSAIVAALIMGVITFTPYQNTVPEKEYYIFSHHDQPYVVSTNYGLYLIQDETDYNGLELNHTYKCDEIYKGNMLANCTEIRTNKE